MMPFISYAQNFEDVMLWRALSDVGQGFYVDVGAGDPDADSVTRAFYERGWSGINVEPFEEFFARLVQARPRDTNLKVAAGRENGLRIMHTFSGTGLSTLDPNISAQHQAAGFKTHPITVPVLTLTKILEDCGAPPVIHFLKIDVEGTEAEVLEGLDLERVRPWIIVVEATKPNTPESSRHNWEHLVTGRKYQFAYFDGLNCFYVGDEVSHLKERLTVPPNFFDHFVQWPEWSKGQRVNELEQEVVALRGHAAGLEAAIRYTRGHAEDLEKLLENARAELDQTKNALQAEQTHAATWREVLPTAQAQQTELRSALQAQMDSLVSMQAQMDSLVSMQAQMDSLVSTIQRWEDESTKHSRSETVRRAFQQLRAIGDRLTGGGVRALCRRALTSSLRPPSATALARKLLRSFPKTAANIHQSASAPKTVVLAEVGPPRATPPLPPHDKSA